ncbi:protein-glutamate O-methyltransferase CheR [Pseudomonas syringae pv. tagetis]|uniref:MCP methyltransferase, CheR-type n=2 Tax=Pseudomonas syringae group genomosp. 7 TaxID=251699 RepID=A0A0Q0BG73_9PSED|nr:protein-glutamate O-methyltransferase CheR [Pseudomonas syringae group genomosp. 7]KPX44185.1 Protein-glutamate O-methyltransferase [Pseudomonas syringae pv. helianthi]KPY88353.1 MCP methyltransferase, CheR-type [Pseudomonas syringae pv. tagetis]RMR05623.1 MCP methyltransferase, CheR-type [Pseudomonas syringae pv. helianthi]RMW15675.1 MCP methyltransferase, CheR-type [Pseudomonas syringae pv. tagetis]RMW17315.1 MCP methyltransferase, CheR-type [Pseudomonas syringae pv. tagetis]
MKGDDSRFFSFLKERIGLDVTSVGEAIIERALRQRATAANCPDSDAYWHLLVSSSQEQQALIEAVIVPETWFFRYPESFVTLGLLARERIASLAGARPLRILSLPCSTGEEPYSIAMALFDAGVEPRQFKVDAIDISPVSIAKAEYGIYGKNSFRGSDIGYRERYFNPVTDGFEIADSVRACVSFQAGNLLDPKLAAQVAYDIVFCRNLVIYFDRQTQQHVFKVLKQLTREDGLLFIGPAEGNLLAGIGMRSIGIAQSFAFRHAPVDVAAPIPVPTATPSAPRPVVEAPVRAPVPPRPAIRTSAAFAPVVKPVAAAGNGEVSALLDRIAGLANEGKSAEARAACERYLQQHEPVAQVFYWLGLLSEVEGNVAQAQGFYRKALYLQPQHPESLAQLAALLAAQGDSAGARRLQDRAARGANKQGNH